METHTYRNLICRRVCVAMRDSNSQPLATTSNWGHRVDAMHHRGETNILPQRRVPWLHWPTNTRLNFTGAKPVNFEMDPWSGDYTFFILDMQNNASPKQITTTSQDIFVFWVNLNHFRSVIQLRIKRHWFWWCHHWPCQSNDDRYHWHDHCITTYTFTACYWLNSILSLRLLLWLTKPIDI